MQQLFAGVPIAHCHVTQARSSVLRLHLPNLRIMDLRVLCASADNPIQINEHTFQTTQQLEELSLQLWDCSGAGLLMAPLCLQPLSLLKDLSLVECGLGHVPDAVSHVSASLTSLDLSCNDDLELCEADANILLKLQKLRKLDVRKENGSRGERRKAELWYDTSIQVLIDLPGRFMAQHGPAPTVAFAASHRGY